MALLDLNSNELEQVCSVGIGGDYPDLDLAMRDVVKMTGWDDLGIGGLASINKNSDLMITTDGSNFSAAQPGDFINIVGAHRNGSNNTVEDATKLFLEITNDTATEARLVTGVNLGVANAPWSIIRPRSVILRLLNQVHDLSLINEYFVLPEYLKFTLVGDDGARLANSGQKIHHRRFNSIYFCNFSAEEVREPFYFDNGTYSYDSTNYAYEGLVKMTDVVVDNTSTSIVDPLGSKVVLSNIKGEAMIRNPVGDDILITDCFLKTTSVYSDETCCFDFAHHYNYQTTKKAIISNCHFYVASSAVCLALGTNYGIGLIKDYCLSNCYVGTAYPQGKAALYLRYGKYLISNCVIDGKIDLADNYSVVNFVNTRQPDGAFPILINASNATITVDGVPYQA